MILRNSELKTYLANNFSHDLEELLQAPPEPIGIRINPLKTIIEEQKNKFHNLNVRFENLPFDDTGILINQDNLPLSHTLDHFLGKFQYQGLSSQLPPIILDPQPGEIILDMAAAPGSKSTQIAALMNNTGTLYLNDINRHRLQALNTNLQRNGVKNQVILNLPGERLGMLFPNFFDRILLDAPCTALGTLHQNNEIDLWWSYDKLKKLCALQTRLLISAFKALKPGGILVYSTCSITPEENEEIVFKLIKEYPLEVESVYEIDATQFDRGLKTDLQDAIRIYPHRHNMEGFFLVKLRKSGTQKFIIDQKKSKYNQTIIHDNKYLLPELNEISQKWGIPPEEWENYRYILTKSRIWLLDKNIDRVPQSGFTNAGLLLAERKSSSWKLLNQSVQFFRQFMTTRIELNDMQLKELFSNGFLMLPGVPNGYHTLGYKCEPIASVYCMNQRLQIRLPHLYTLPEINPQSMSDSSPSGS